MNSTRSDDRVDPRPLFAQLLHTASEVRYRLERELEPTGISLPQLRVLRHLAMARVPLPLGELAERLACGRSNMTQLADRLEEDGLVKRVPDAEDRRSVRAELTEEGRRRVEAGFRAAMRVERALEAELGGGGPERMSRALARIRAVMGVTGGADGGTSGIGRKGMEK